MSTGGSCTSSRAALTISAGVTGRAVMSMLVKDSLELHNSWNSIEDDCVHDHFS